MHVSTGSRDNAAKTILVVKLFFPKGAIVPITHSNIMNIWWLNDGRYRPDFLICRLLIHRLHFLSWCVRYKLFNVVMFSKEFLKDNSLNITKVLFIILIF